MGSTLKVLSAGRYGARYGIGIRKRLLKVEFEQKKKHPCPSCGYPKVKRLQRGIFFCRKCDLKFSGGAYSPYTMAGQIIRKMVSQKSFMPMVAELTVATEDSKGVGLAREIREELEQEKEGERLGEGKPEKPVAKKIRKQPKEKRPNARKAKAGKAAGETGAEPKESKRG